MSDLIHCITNPISINLCANAVLSLKARPIMAEHPLEVKEITATASALLLNFGNISDTRMEAMKISFSEALEKEIPVVIDAVGVACSRLRRDFFFQLIEKYKGTKGTVLEGTGAKGTVLVKGNYAEIKALSDNSYSASGVDTDEELKDKTVIELAKELSKELGVLVLASGKRDIVTDGDYVLLNDSGHPMMGEITGTGCVLGAICATFLARQDSLESVSKACSFFGIAGERAYESLSAKTAIVGTGSFQTALLDELCFEDATCKKDSACDILASGTD